MSSLANISYCARSVGPLVFNLIIIMTNKQLTNLDEVLEELVRQTSQLAKNLPDPDTLTPPSAQRRMRAFKQHVEAINVQADKMVATLDMLMGNPNFKSYEEDMSALYLREGHTPMEVDEVEPEMAHRGIPPAAPSSLESIASTIEAKTRHSRVKVPRAMQSKPVSTTTS